MAIRVTTHQVCDRCLKPYAEEHIKYGQAIPEYQRKPLRLTHGDHVVLTYEDLCEDCDRVVQGLIKKMKLERDPDPKKAKVEPEVLEPTAPVEAKSSDSVDF